MGGCGNIEMRSLTMKCPYRLIGVVCLQFDSSFLSNCLLDMCELVHEMTSILGNMSFFWGGRGERTF